MTSTIPTCSGIYCIRCISTDKIYIGSAQNLRIRHCQHFRSLHRNAHPNINLQRAFNKYGEESFVFEILELVLLPELLTAREQHFFDILKPFGKKGFNVARVAGSNLGIKLSDVTRERLRISHLGQVAHNRGKKHAPESIEKMRVVHRGKPSPKRGTKLPDTVREKLRIANLGKKQSEETIRKRVEKMTGKKRSAEAIEKTRLAHIGMEFSQESREKMSRSAQGNTSHAKDFIVTSPDGIEYKVHNLKAFCRERDLNSALLGEVARGNRPHHKGWTARYPDSEAG